jgi:hypothetical protein
MGGGLVHPARPNAKPALSYDVVEGVGVCVMRGVDNYTGVSDAWHSIVSWFHKKVSHQSIFSKTTGIVHNLDGDS